MTLTQMGSAGLVRCALGSGHAVRREQAFSRTALPPQRSAGLALGSVPLKVPLAVPIKVPRRPWRDRCRGEVVRLEVDRGRALLLEALDPDDVVGRPPASWESGTGMMPSSTVAPPESGARHSGWPPSCQVPPLPRQLGPVPIRSGC